jgi:6-pyruvoyltetrahydropterin/6-carboxytetrahydropterin synthase
MYSVTKVIQFSYGHRLLDYNGKCSQLHGHNGKIDIELSRDRLDRRGMVWDFDEIKKKMQRWIDANLDHAMLLRKDDPAVKPLRKLRERIFLMEANPTAESIAKLIFDYAKQCRFPVSAVRFWETERSCATYRLS